MSRKQLIVHAGANKTGSSAIQRFLAINASTLRGNGIVVPDQDLMVRQQVSGFHVFAFEQLFRDPAGASRFTSTVGEIARAAADAGTILLSAENLAANPAAPALFAQLLDEYDVRVILYVRRQDQYLLSSWQQWYSKISDDFWAWALSTVGRLGNWRAYLEQWEQVVPREQITVRVFDRARLTGGDVVQDFHGLLNVEAPFERFQYPREKVNPSFSDAIMDLVKGNPLVFRDVHDNDFYNLVLSMTGERYVQTSRRSPITFAQRMAILREYDACNRWVRDAYSPDKDAPLFTPPKETDYEYSSGGQKHAEQLEFLTTMVYALHRSRK